jgi:hypothetical protein
MSFLRLAFLVIGLAAVTEGAQAQHCAGITESYLSEISVKHVKDSLKIKCEYYKQGGRTKEAYQAYLLAYLDEHANKINQSSGEEFFDPEFVEVLHTQVITRDAEDGYKLEFAISNEDFAKMLIKKKPIGDKRRSTGGGFYLDNVRLAVFIPFLEDKKYALLKGLPEDRHECNYSGVKALLFQPLPSSLSIFIPVSGKYHIDLRAAPSAKAPTKSL